MKDFLRVSVATALLTVACGSSAVSPTERVEGLPVLQQESQHSIAAKRVSALFTRSHYKEVELDDALSNKIFDRFMRSLDLNRNVFLASDIKELEKYRNGFDDALEKGDLTPAYVIYQLNLKRRIERFNYAISLLSNEFDFEKAGDKFVYDREEAPWPASDKEFDELWRQRVKYDALNLKLAGKDKEKIKELLGKRYEPAVKMFSKL
jgi:carboxyl-terminal processing protease